MAVDIVSNFSPERSMATGWNRSRPGQFHKYGNAHTYWTGPSIDDPLEG
jgi:hypothetical protein